MTDPPLTLTIKYPCCRAVRRINLRHSRLLVGDNGLVVPPGIVETCGNCLSHHYPGDLLVWADTSFYPPTPPRPLRPRPVFTEKPRPLAELVQEVV